MRICDDNNNYGDINARNTQGQHKEAVLRQSTSPTVPLVPFVRKLELLRSFSEINKKLIKKKKTIDLLIDEKTKVQNVVDGEWAEGAEKG